MANNSKADVLMLFGVEGGGDVRQGSGKDIYDAIKQIVAAIEADITEQLQFKADPKALNKLKLQVEEAVTDALSSIKDTPIELQFVFDQKSVDKEFAKVKKQMKEQSIIVTAQPQSKKAQGSTSDASPVTSGTAKKETEETKQEVKELGKVAENTTKEIVQGTQEVKEEFNQVNALIDKMIAKFAEVDAGGYMEDELRKFREEKKRAFSTTEIELFGKAIDLAIEKDSLGSIFDYMKSIKDEAVETAEVIKSLSHYLSSPLRTSFTHYGDVFSEYTDSQSSTEQYAREWVWRFLKSRRSKAARQSGYEIRWGDLMDYMDTHDADLEYYRNSSGNIDANDFLNQAAQYARKTLEYQEDATGKAYLVLKDYEAFEEQMKLAKESVKGIHDSLKEINSAIDRFAKAFSIEPDIMGDIPATYEQLIEFGKSNPKAQEALIGEWKGWSRLGRSRFFAGKDIFADLSEVRQDFDLEYISKALEAAAESAKEAQPVLDYVEQEIEDLSEDGKTALQTVEEVQYALAKYKPTFDVSQFAYFPGSADSFKSDNYDSAILTQGQLKSLSSDTIQGITPTLLALPEISTATQELIDKAQGLEDVADAIDQIGDSSEEAAVKGERLNKTTLTQINNLKAGFGEHGKETESYREILALQRAITTGDYGGTGFDNANDALERMNELIPVAQRELKKFDKEAREEEKIQAANRRKAEKAIEQQEKAYDKLSETLAKANRRITTVQNELNNLDTSQFKAGDQTEDWLQRNINEVVNLRDALRDYLLYEDEAGRQSFDWASRGITGVSNLSEAVDKLNSSLTAVESQMKKTQGSSGFVPDEATISVITRYNNAIKTFRETKGAEAYGDLMGLSYIDPSKLEASKDIVKTLTKETDRLTAATKELNEQHRREENVLTQRNKIYQEADNYYKKYQSGIKANITLNQKWLDLIEKVKSGEFGDDNESARRALAELQTETKEANAETMTLWGSLKKLFTDHFGAVSATAFIGTLRNVAREAYENVLAIDKAMTELRKVTDETETRYKQFMSTAADLAAEVGGTIADTISSTADFARLGFNLDQSTALSKAAMVYKNVGDGITDISEASESIISTIKAFSDIDTEDALSIIDRFNEVGNNYAISSQGIGIALQKSAAALASANNSLDESIALITAGKQNCLKMWKHICRIHLTALIA